MTQSKKKAQPINMVGWREWIAIPSLHVSKIKVKIDTGARSSALHAYDIKTFYRDGVAMVRFKVHPIQRSTRETISAQAEIHDERIIRSSSGHEQLRIVIRPQIQLGDIIWPIDLTLTNRDVMGFRMLLGREAVRERFLIHAGRSYIFGKPNSF